MIETKRTEICDLLKMNGLKQYNIREMSGVSILKISFLKKDECN